MLVGTSRWLDARETLVELVQDELREAGLPASLDDVAAALGHTRASLAAAPADADSLQALVDTWDEVATRHDLAHLIVLDHGDEVEILLGRPPHPPPP
jgi:hypothetical protein